MKNILTTWMTLVSKQDVEGVVDLYLSDGLLLGTFSDEIRVGKEKISDYFEFFLSKKPHAKLLNNKTHIINEDSFTVSGFYDFEVDKSDTIRESVHARFTFVFQKKNGVFKILSHHSSLIP